MEIRETRGFTQTGMISALFSIERRGEICEVTCSLLPGWRMYFRTVNEFVIWWKATMIEAAQSHYTHHREGNA